MGALLEKKAADSGESSPATLSSLLRALHAERQSALRQQGVLRHWLDEHDPGKSLRISLRANGFGLLLNEIDAARPPHEQN
jgi:hypothetical protein